MLKNQSGMSLLEVMIASTLMVGVALFMVNMSRQTQKTIKDFEQRIEIIQMAKDIEGLLVDRAICENSFKGLNLSVEEIIIKKGTDIVQQATPYAAQLENDVNKLTLALLEYENIDLPLNGTGHFFINYQFRKSIGVKLSRKYQVKVKATNRNGLVQSCFSDGGTLASNIAKSVCYSLGGTPLGDKCTNIDGNLIKRGSLPLDRISGTMLLTP